MFQDRGCDTYFAPQAHTDTIIPPLEFQSLRIKSHRLEIKIHLRGCMKCTSFRNYRRRQKRNISEGAALTSILVRKTNKVNPLNKEMTAGMATPSLPSASSTESLTEGPGEGAPQIRRFLSTILRSSPFRLGLRRSPKLGAEAQPGSRRVGSPSLQSSRQMPTTPSRRTPPQRHPAMFFPIHPQAPRPTRRRGGNTRSWREDAPPSLFKHMPFNPLPHRAIHHGRSLRGSFCRPWPPLESSHTGQTGNGITTTLHTCKHYY